MRYNPKINESAARLRGFASLHPMVPDALAQGALAVMHGLQVMLGKITGLPAVTLEPAAGAHGELTGMMLIRKRLIDRDARPRKTVLIPDWRTAPIPPARISAATRSVRSSRASAAMSPPTVWQPR